MRKVKKRRSKMSREYDLYLQEHVDDILDKIGIKLSELEEKEK